MAITATQEGRNLHIHVEGVDPFIVTPLPGKAGMQITETYLMTAAGAVEAADMPLALVMALDGAVLEDDRWVPVPAEQRNNSNRMHNEISLAEIDTVAMCAFLWQTILNMKGVEIFLSAEGVEGHTKALGALVARMGLSPLQTSPSSALENLTLLLGSTPSTSTLPAGVSSVKQPQDRRPKKPKRKKA